jgi:hypothetical protein
MKSGYEGEQYYMANVQDTRRDRTKLECIRGGRDRTPALQAPAPKYTDGNHYRMNYYIWKHIEKGGME